MSLARGGTDARVIVTVSAAPGEVDPESASAVGVSSESPGSSLTLPAR